jgi:hypothetical protein
METQRSDIPTVEHFLQAPIEEVARVAPATIILSLGGTRRGAILAGVTPHSDSYAVWIRETMFACLDLLFCHGVQHIVVTAVVPANLVEFATFRTRFLSWVEQGMVGPEAMDAYAQHGWQVRLIGTACPPELRPSAERLRMNTPKQAAHRLWWWVASEPDAALHELLAADRRTRAQTRAELVQELYGEDIPPATLFLAFGKPIVSTALLPPLLIGDAQCYWMQRPGHSLDAAMIRRIFYDYAYMRPTGSGMNRSGRYTDVLDQRAAWEVEAVLGVGQRLGPFWYPAPFPDCQ